MASIEASSSRAADALPSRVDDAGRQAQADELASLGNELSQLMAASGSSNLLEAAKKSRAVHASKQRQVEEKMLNQAPAYLKLHKDIQSSQNTLAELSSFLGEFHTDLGALSKQMDALQRKSISLRQRLQNRRSLEQRLRDLVDRIVLEPRHIDLIFADEATARGAGLEAWRTCAEQLSACLLACQELKEVLRDETQGKESASPLPQGIDFKALEEAQQLAEACRIAAAAKLRPLLISTFTSLKTSVSTNLPVWQSLSLRTYRSLFTFLSQHVPRVAIDVQRAYISAARLYFETGFRRYERTLAKLRDKEKARGIDNLSFVDAPAKSSFGPMFGAASSNAASRDPWLPEATQLEYAKIVDGPAVTLAYLADEPNYRAPLEALYRSLSMTFLDNASSEFCFLARFFESIDLSSRESNVQANSTSTHTDRSSAVKVQSSDAQHRHEDSEGIDPDDSASAQGNETTIVEADEQDRGTVVRLSDAEKRRIQSRGAISELWKQVMEPSLNTYTGFVKSILDLHPPLLSLLSMARLNELMLDEVQVRGTASVLQGPLMSFKLQAWPIIQRQFDDVIESVRKLHGSDPGKAASSASASILGGLGGMFGGYGGGSGARGSGTVTGEDILRLVCTRYAYLFSCVVKLSSDSSSGQLGDAADTQSGNVFASLVRLRTEVETLIAGYKARTPASVSIAYSTVRTTLETGPAPVSWPSIQKELSHWTEAERASRTS